MHLVLGILIILIICLQKIETSVGNELDDVTNPSKGYQYFDSARKNGEQYKIGDCCYIDPDAYDFAIKPEKPGSKLKTDRKVVNRSDLPRATDLLLQLLESFKKERRGRGEGCPKPPVRIL